MQTAAKLTPFHCRTSYRWYNRQSFWRGERIDENCFLSFDQLSSNLFHLPEKANTMREKPEGSSWWLIVDECCRENLTNVGKMKIWYFWILCGEKMKCSSNVQFVLGSTRNRCARGQGYVAGTLWVRIDWFNLNPLTTKRNSDAKQPKQCHNTMKQRYVSVYHFVDTLLGKCISNIVHFLSNDPLKGYVAKRKLYFASLAFNTCAKSTHQKVPLTHYVLVTTKATQQSIWIIHAKQFPYSYIGGSDTVDLVQIVFPGCDCPSQRNHTFLVAITRFASTNP